MSNSLRRKHSTAPMSPPIIGVHAIPSLMLPPPLYVRRPQSTTMRDKAIDLCGGVKLTTDWTVTFIAFLATCATLVS